MPNLPFAPPAYGRLRGAFQWLATLALAFWLAGAAAAADPAKVLALGDSLTAGYGLPPEEALPAQLERKLAAEGIAVRIINAGVSGDTSAGGRARLGWALADNPRYAIVALGANDMLRGIDPAVTRANIDAILTELGRRDIKVLLAGMYAGSNLGSAYAEQFNAIYPELARKHNVLFYPFLLEGVAMQANLNQPDGIHPNARGVAIIVDRLAPLVAKLVNGA